MTQFPYYRLRWEKEDKTMAEEVKRKPGLVWYPEPRFDTYVFPAGALSSAPFFSVPIGGTLGGAATIKTVADTNLRNSAMIGNPNQFELHGFAVSPQWSTGLVATEMADWAKIYDTGVFTFQMGGSKNLLEIPLSMIPMASGPNAVGTTTAGAATPGNGAPFASNYYKFHKLISETGQKEQLLLGGDTNFSITISYPLAAITLSVAKRVRVLMVGYYGSAIQ